MSNLTPLTAKNGESEWPCGDRIIIAVETDPVNCCDLCCLCHEDCSKIFEEYNIADCITDFDVSMNFIEKPVAK
jgi:hypothetical protein